MEINLGTDLIAAILDSLHRALFAVASLLRQAFRKRIERQVRIQRNDPILGLDTRWVFPNFLQAQDLKDCIPDSFDTEHSTMFEDDEWCGLGGWGNPDDDSQITTGGFKDAVRMYPRPHRIRRSYTLRPLGNIPKPFPNDPLAPPLDPTIMINETYTKENYDFLVNGFPGDFIGFQAYLEGPQVCELCSASFVILTQRCRARTAVLILSWEVT